MATKAKARKTAAGKAKKVTKAAPEVPVEVPVEVPAPVRMTAQDREAVAADVLDLTLLLLQRRLRDSPDAVHASGIAEVTKLLGLFYRYRDKLDKGAEADGWQDYIKNMPAYPAYTDDDKDDPMLQGNRAADEYQAPVVSPEDLARLADFDHD